MINKSQITRIENECINLEMDIKQLKSILDVIVDCEIVNDMYYLSVDIFYANGDFLIFKYKTNDYTVYRPRTESHVTSLEQITNCYESSIFTLMESYYIKVIAA